MTHVCPPGYCNCSRGFDGSIEDTGCLLEYGSPLAICHYTRKGVNCYFCVPVFNIGFL